jgi:sugar O-acyltransferase (sialic acid O-acetyltransferase NeuD family)
MKNSRSKTGKTKTIVLIGARLDGHAGVIVDTLSEIGRYELIGFIDNTPELKGKLVSGVPVLGSTEDIEEIEIPGDCVHIAIGDNVARGRLFDLLKKKGVKVETLIHPTAVVSTRAQVGEGCFVGPRAVINNGVTIGEASIINTGVIIEHDNKLGFAVHIAPGGKTAGRVRVGDYAFVGLGASILPDICIGSGAMIGAGSTVVNDVSSKTTVIGYAAKKHKKNIYLEVKPDVGFTEKIYVAQPTLPDYPLIEKKFRDISSSLMLSNFAKYSSELEITLEEKLQVRKALTFPNATSALMLALKAMDLEGEVILPSFTFSATGHAVIWNGLVPVFADIERETFNIDPDDVERKITENTSAILAVHVFGNPADVERLEALAKKHGLKLLFDSAHALGSIYKGRPIGSFGDAECFSLSGTKVITSAEGGVVTSNDEKLAEKISLGRNYGAGSDYNCQYIGLNGKMSEFHAAIALESLSLLDKFLQKRNKLAMLYRERLGEIPGISFQRIPDGHISTYKDFAIVVDPEVFGMDRNALITWLKGEGIFPKKYFYPPLHMMDAYKNVECRAEGLENTDYVARNVVCLPIFSHMNSDKLEKICYAVDRVQRSLKKATGGSNMRLSTWTRS